MNGVVKEQHNKAVTAEGELRASLGLIRPHTLRTYLATKVFALALIVSAIRFVQFRALQCVCAFSHISRCGRASIKVRGSGFRYPRGGESMSSRRQQSSTL